MTRRIRLGSAEFCSVVGGLAVALAACAAPAETVGASPADTARSMHTSSTSSHGTSAGPATDGNGMRTGVFPSTRVDPPTDADRPDGPPPTPDDELTPTQLAGLIRVKASAAPARGRCAPDDVRLALSGFDGAAGHRYAVILATNVTRTPCTLVGWPGLGFRGGWGTAFPMVAERSTTEVDRVGAQKSDPSQPVTVRPGGQAVAELEWTGARAGAHQERVSLIAVQLVAGDPVAALKVDPSDHVDLGAETTVRISRWLPA